MKNLNYPIKFLSLIHIILLFMACNSHDNDIKNLISQIYKVPFPYNNHTLAEQVLSKKLGALIVKAKKVEEKSIESIPESELGNIKPHIIEGDIFSSLYEGHESYSITKISVNKDSAFVEVKFTNNTLGTSNVCIDELVIVDENGWKLDNVIYKKNIPSKDIKNVLHNFIKEYKRNN